MNEICTHMVLLKGRNRKVIQTGNKKVIDMFFSSDLQKDQNKPRSVPGSIRTTAGSGVIVI